MSEFCVADFASNGFAGPISVLSRKEAQVALAQACTACTMKEGGGGLDEQTGDSPPAKGIPLQGNQRFKVHLFLSEMNRIARHPSVLNAVREALETPHIALWSSDLNVKEPHSQQYFSAHQDATYTGLHPAHKCLTVWVALSDPVGIEEGCMSFLRGSHQAGQLPHIEEKEADNSNDVDQDSSSQTASYNDTGAGTNLLSRGQRVEWDATFSKDDWVAVPLRAGEATMHHFHTIHQSGYNHHPTQPRVGLALRYMAAGVHQTGPLRESITWIDADTGNEDEACPREKEEKRMEMAQYFDFEPVLPLHPSKEDLLVGREAHLEAMRREAGNYFQDSAAVKAYDEKR